MSSFVACLDRRGRPIDPTGLEAMLAASPERAVDGQDLWIDGPVALARQHFWVTPEEVGERQPLRAADGETVLVSDARLDNRPGLCGVLGVSVSPEVTDAALLSLAYRQWGRAMVDHLLGDFAFVVWDARRRRLFAARDGMGARGLGYYVDEQRVLIASEMRQLLAHPAVERRVNENKVADFLVDAWDDHHQSFWQGLRYCPPGFWLEVGPLGVGGSDVGPLGAGSNGVRLERYWRLDPSRRLRLESDAAYAEHFLEVAREAVACRLRVAGRVGVSLSGGLDSTTVLALTASASGSGSRSPEAPLEVRSTEPGSIEALSYVFDELASCDERPYIHSVLEHLAAGAGDRAGVSATEIVGDDLWPLRDLDTWPTDPGFVFGDPYARLALAVVDGASRRGCRALLTGHFGDMLFLGGAYWAADLLREGRWRALAHQVRAAGPALRWRTDLVSHGLCQLLPGARWNRWRQRPAGAHPMLHPDFVSRTSLTERLAHGADRDLTWRHYAGPGQWARFRGLTSAAGPQGAMAARSWFTRRGVERLDPLADRRLVELAMALPADQLGRPGRTRWVLRDAMRGLLPEAVRERRTKTVFSPLFVKGLREREAATVRQILRQPEIVARGIVRREWLDAQLETQFQHGARWPDSGHALWKCISLELWLRRHGGSG